MARKTLKDDDGNEYDVDLPDDDKSDGDDDDDEDTIYLDAEDIEWLKRKRLEESESQRKASTTQRKASGGKIVKIRAKGSTTSPSQTGAKSTRRRVLKLA